MITAPIILAFNLVNWLVKLAVWMVVAPVQLVSALPTPLDYLAYVLVGAFLARKFLTRSHVVRGLDLAEVAIARIRSRLREQ